MAGIFLFPVLSESQPEKMRKKLDIVFAAPSISPISNFEMPRVTDKKNGMIDWIISLEKSLNRLTNPRKKAFLFSPKIFFCGGMVLIITYSSQPVLPSGNTINSLLRIFDILAYPAPKVSYREDWIALYFI